MNSINFLSKLAIVLNCVMIAFAIYSKDMQIICYSTICIIFLIFSSHTNNFCISVLEKIKLQQNDNDNVLTHIQNVIDHSREILMLNNFKTYGIIEPYSKWKHYKGGEYIVLTLGFSTVDRSELVIYKDSSDRIWARPFKEWEEEILFGNAKIKRFIRI